MFLEGLFIQPYLQARQRLDVLLKKLPITMACALTPGSGAGTYTKTFTIPKGFAIVDIAVKPATAWNSGTSAVMTIGDATDADGFITALELKTLSTTSSYAAKGSGVGAYGGAAVTYTIADTLTIKVVATGSGTTGYTNVIVTLVPVYLVGLVTTKD